MNFARQFDMVDTFGIHHPGEELVSEMLENGIIREVDSTGRQFSLNIERALSNQNSYKSLGRELGKWWAWPSMVEDYARAALYLNGKRMGMSGKESTKLVNKALFDYQRGLSHIERTVIRRLLPFYSFQRFAIPFILKETLKKPGNAATLDKVARTAEKLLVTGETLTPGEENVFNGDKSNYLLTQARLVSGFDSQGNLQLNVLNNLTPFDVLNLFAYDKEGKVDYQASAEKIFLGAMTPYFKIPLEAMLDRDFFTQNTIDKASTYGDLEGSLETLLPDAVKELIGWESRTNVVSGKTTTFISPYMGYYAMQVFPFLRDYIKGNEDVDYGGSNVVARALFSAMNILVESSIGGLSKQQKIDLKEKSQWEAIKVGKEFENLNKQLMRAKIIGSEMEFEKAQKDLMNLITTFSQNNAMRTNIRGQGIGQEIQQGETGEGLEPIPSTLQQPFK
jgi:hypothetical protein